MMTCPIGGCRYDLRLSRKCPLDGAWCPTTEYRKVDCGVLGPFRVGFVTACTCCKDPGIQIDGVVVDSVNRRPIKKVLLRINRKTKAKSDADGKFSATVPRGTIRVVIKAVKRRGSYIETTKVVEIAPGFKGPVPVTVVMVTMAEPIEVDSNEDTKIPVSAEQSDIAVIGIPGGSYRTKRGSYEGKVRISANYIDTSDRTVRDVVPGQFITGRRARTDPLITDGMFSLVIRGESGQSLIADNVIVRIREGMRLWELNNDGIWQPLPDSRRRRKRQIGVTDEFLLSIDSAAWVNIDKIPGAPPCYFKARVFNELSDAEIPASLTAMFRPEAVAYTTLNQRLRFYLAATDSPASTCHEVRCPDISDPADTLVGLINMHSYESVSVGGSVIPHVTKLTPRPLVDYSPALLPPLGVVQYATVPDREAYVNFISNPAGPFYPTKSLCEASTTDDSALHFLKPDLPSYVPYPPDTPLCTARVGLFNGSGFFDAVDALDSPPTVSAVSTWEDSGTNYFYTDTGLTGCSSVDGDFLYVCLLYRCSQAGSLTTVRIDIDIPEVSINGSVRDVPAFQCRPSDCVTDDCLTDGVVSIDGSFEAPVVVGSGPDFFNVSPNDCADRSADEEFALTFTCFGKRR